MDPQSPQLLIVDDAPESLDILLSILGEEADIRVATDGEQALELTARDMPDLVLLDIVMPGMDGFEVCQHLHGDPRTATVPVIFISGLEEPEDKIRAFLVGGVDYVTKPFHPEEVCARVHTHLRLRRQQQQLAAQYAQLEELETLRDNLTHMIVHDMRSPLNVVNGYLEMVLLSADRYLPEDQCGFLRQAHEATNRLIEMVSSLLDVSKMENRQLRLDRSPTDVNSLARRAIDSLGATVRLGHFDVRVAGAPETADCDAELIFRVLMNLVANALQASSRGGVVTVHVAGDDARVRVTVVDHGHGIPAADRARIFEKFGQVATRQAGRKHSTGLGLTFCKLAVEAHGGAIGVDSVEGQGSTFWFTLPRGAA